MRAIILAAGVGRRLGDSIEERPKSLVDLGGITLLGHLLDHLQALRVTPITIVVGHLSHQIEAAVKGREGVRTVFNPEYRKGAVVSLWTAREELCDDVLIMDADVLCPIEMLQRLIGSSHVNCFLMDSEAKDDGEAQMLMATKGRVHDIRRGVRGSYDASGESIGFLKLSGPAAETLRNLIDRAVSSGRDGIEHEEVYPELMAACEIGYETVEGLEWLEVDFPEDVACAREMVAKRALRARS